MDKNIGIFRKDVSYKKSTKKENQMEILELKIKIFK
jgi:hypothetical protein